jgi:hypothetical protein
MIGNTPKPHARAMRAARRLRTRNSGSTVRRAKASVAPGRAPEFVIGKDGKPYPATRKTREDGIPSIDRPPRGDLWDDQDGYMGSFF